MQLAEKEAQRAYADQRAAEVDAMNEELQESVEELDSILRDTLGVDDYLDFDDLKDELKLPPFAPGNLGIAEPIPRDEDFLPGKPGLLAGLFPGSAARHQRRLEAGEASLQAAKTEHAVRKLDRNARLEAARREHALSVQAITEAVERQHAEIESFRAAFMARDPDAVVRYFALVLEASGYPKSFPRRAKLAYLPESLQLVVEYDFPIIECIPEEASYRYVKNKDEILSITRSASQRRTLYASVLAQVCLRTIHEIFEADRSGNVASLVFNGHVDTVDAGTGKEIHPCLITVRTSHDHFLSIDLSKVEPSACLRVLNASISKSPAELAPVRPILEFNMVDRRFVKETDVLSGLDSRPNLMTLTPSEFESLITNLFVKMGLETRLTQASRDGGVDCVAFDPRPIFGGKVVIQAKRYKNTVGVGAVRDLFGTMHNEGASKGILVTTSGYGKASFDFADGKPLELLSGSNLLYLLAEHAGIEAKIEPPDEWTDPLPDT